MSKETKDFFIAKFEKALRIISRAELIFLQPMPLPESRPVSLLPCSRVIAPLTGVMPFTFSDGRKIIEANLTSASAIYARPFGWSNPDWNDAFEFVSLVIHNNYLRFIHLNHDGSDVPPDGPEERKSCYHTAIGPTRTLSLLVGVMNSYSEDAACDMALARDCLVLLISEAIRQLKSDQAVPLGKSYHTWQHIREFMRENSSLPITRNSLARPCPKRY